MPAGSGGACGAAAGVARGRGAAGAAGVALRGRFGAANPHTAQRGSPSALMLAQFVQPHAAPDIAAARGARACCFPTKKYAARRSSNTLSRLSLAHASAAQGWRHRRWHCVGRLHPFLVKVVLSRRMCCTGESLLHWAPIAPPRGSYRKCFNVCVSFAVSGSLDQQATPNVINNCLCGICFSFLCLAPSPFHPAAPSIATAGFLQPRCLAATSPCLTPCSCSFSRP